MKQLYLQKSDWNTMAEAISAMSREEIEKQLHALGCELGYDEIKEKLGNTYNDLAVSDMIFETQRIDDSNTAYPKGFIDEAVLEIAKRENYDFTHYGIISDRILDIMENGKENAGERLLEQFRLLFKTAKKFKAESLEGMSYQVNDGVDMIAVVMFLLDVLMEEGTHNKQAYQTIVSFVDKFLSVFPKTSEFFRVSMQYEQGQAYIAMKSKKGEQLYQNLLKTHKDTTEVVLHYALSYLDKDEKKACSILKRYADKLDSKSESFDEIEALQKELNIK